MSFTILYYDIVTYITVNYRYGTISFLFKVSLKFIYSTDKRCIDVNPVKNLTSL